MSKPSITSEFDPSNEHHVMWLKKTSESFKAAMKGEKVDFMKAANNHPFSRKSQIEHLTGLRFISQSQSNTQTRFLKKKAFIPK